MVLMTGCAIADIRPDIIKHTKEKDELEEKGRRLMEKTLLHHNLGEWQEHETYRALIINKWYGLPKLFNKMPADANEFLLTSITGRFDAQLKILEGKHKGNVWGVQEGQGYIMDEEGEIISENSKDVALALSTLQYFLVFPFRIIEAPVIAYAGEKEYKGKLYDRLFVTWEKYEPHKKHDQFIVWINQNSGFIEMIEFTSRETSSFITGAMVFEEYDKMAGVWLARKMKGKTSLRSDNIVRLIEIKEFAFDQVPVSEVYVRGISFSTE